MKKVGDRRKPLPGALIAVDSIGTQTITMYPFGAGDLTLDGTQFSVLATTSSIESIYATAVVATVSPPIHGDIAELEMELIASIRTDSSVESTVSWQFQARNVGVGNFQDLHALDTTVSWGTAFVETTHSGLVALTDNLDRLPLEIQLLIRSEEEFNCVGRVSNQSYVKSVVSALYDRKQD